MAVSSSNPLTGASTGTSYDTIGCRTGIKFTRVSTVSVPSSLSLISCLRGEALALVRGGRGKSGERGGAFVVALRGSFVNVMHRHVRQTFPDPLRTVLVRIPLPN